MCWRHVMSMRSPATMARIQRRSASPRWWTITPSELAVGAGFQRSWSSSRFSSLKIALSRRWCSQARAIAISSAGALSSGRGTRSSGGASCCGRSVIDRQFGAGCPLLVGLRAADEAVGLEGGVVRRGGVVEGRGLVLPLLRQSLDLGLVAVGAGQVSEQFLGRIELGLVRVEEVLLEHGRVGGFGVQRSQLSQAWFDDGDDLLESGLQLAGRLRLRHGVGLTGHADTDRVCL